jgi:acyl-ACP thioesterase
MNLKIESILTFYTYTRPKKESRDQSRINYSALFIFISADRRLGAALWLQIVAACTLRSRIAIAAGL